jgi:hypothetical protein
MGQLGVSCWCSPLYIAQWIPGYPIRMHSEFRVRFSEVETTQRISYANLTDARVSVPANFTDHTAAHPTDRSLNRS